MRAIEAWWCPECKHSYPGPWNHGVGDTQDPNHKTELCVIIPEDDWSALMALVSAAYDFEEATQRREQRLAELHVIHAVRALPPEIIAAAREGRS